MTDVTVPFLGRGEGRWGRGGGGGEAGGGALREMEVGRGVSNGELREMEVGRGVSSSL